METITIKSLHMSIIKVETAEVTKTLIPAQRRERIQEILATHHIISSAELCELLEVSEATVRRDLEWLENDGILERTHGGAMLNQRVQLELQYVQRIRSHAEEKRQIGQVAASMIEDGDIIFVNSGTTTTEVIRHIPSTANITIVTNNVTACLELSEVSYELLLVGGSYLATSQSVAGRFAIDNLNRIYANKAILAVDGLSLKFGCTVPTNAEAEVNQLMIQRNRGPLIVVTDHSKWGIVSNFEIAKIDHIQTLVTDEGLDLHAREALSAYPLNLVFAGQKQPESA
jgi:DeoR family transcriptional regulator, fructose operon transcriptional repressor